MRRGERQRGRGACRTDGTISRSHSSTRDLAQAQLLPAGLIQKAVELVTDSGQLWRSTTSCARASSVTAPRSRRGRQHFRRWSDAEYPRFRRDLCAPDVAFDPGGTTMPRIPALHMLRSTMNTVSTPAISSFRGSIPHPTHSLCTQDIRPLSYRNNSQYPLS